MFLEARTDQRPKWKTINFSLRTAFAASHRGWIIVFSLSFFSRYFFIFSLFYSVIFWLFNNVEFSLHVFVFFYVFFPVIDFYSHGIVVQNDT